MPEPKKYFTQAFRDEAVRLTQTSGRSRREIAVDLGIGLSNTAELDQHAARSSYG